MLCATKVLDTGPARVGSIVGNITLPRTVEIRVLVAAAIGSILLFLMTSFVLGISLRQTTMSLIIGGAIGVFTQKFSPAPGETVFSFAWLRLTSAASATKADGQRRRVYVGMCPVQRVAGGPTRIVAGAVDVPAGSVDDRFWRRDRIEAPAPAPIRRAALRADEAVVFNHAAPTTETADVPSWMRRHVNGEDR